MSGSDPNDIGEGRKHIIEGTKNSLKNYNWIIVMLSMPTDMI